MIKDMKWYGWGDPKFEYPLDEKPLLWPFVTKTLGLAPDCKKTPPVDRAAIKFPAPRTNADFMREMNAELKPDQLAADEEQRLIHTYGKSFPDLYRVRKGEVPNAPDLVI